MKSLIEKAKELIEEAQVFFEEHDLTSDVDDPNEVIGGLMSAKHYLLKAEEILDEQGALTRNDLDGFQYFITNAQSSIASIIDNSVFITEDSGNKVMTDGMRYFTFSKCLNPLSDALLNLFDSASIAKDFYDHFPSDKDEIIKMVEQEGDVWISFSTAPTGHKVKVDANLHMDDSGEGETVLYSVITDGREQDVTITEEPLFSMGKTKNVIAFLQTFEPSSRDNVSNTPSVSPYSSP